MTDINGKPELIFNRSGWTCAVCGEFVPGNVNNHVHDSAKIIAEFRFNNSVLSDALVLADRNFLQVNMQSNREKELRENAESQYGKVYAENDKLRALLAEKYEIYLLNCAEIDRLQKRVKDARNIIGQSLMFLKGWEVHKYATQWLLAKEEM